MSLPFRARTDQEKVDAMTMNISKPTVGSGYIEHPPQAGPPLTTALRSKA